MSDEWPQEVRDLAQRIGPERIKKYVGYIEDRDKLADCESFSLPANSGSVLRDTDISYLCNSRSLPLLDPFDEQSLLGSASYHLRLGSKYRVGHSDGYLSTENRVIEIPRHGIAIVSTHEWLNIPGFLIARWNLKVKMVYRGLVWVGSLQVDPGYQGFLFCPLYNLSDETQRLTYMEPLFTIDFVVTSKYEEGPGSLWTLPDKYSTFDFARLDARRIQSAPQAEFDRQWGKIGGIRQDVDEAIEGVRRFQGVVFALIAIIFTALAVLATIGATNVTWDSDTVPAVLSRFAFALSGLALGFVIYKYRRWKR